MRAVRELRINRMFLMFMILDILRVFESFKTTSLQNNTLPCKCFGGFNTDLTDFCCVMCVSTTVCMYIGAYMLTRMS